MKVLGNRILLKEVVKQKKDEETGIILPKTGISKFKTGVVHYVGQGTKDEPMEIEVNDTVMFSRMAGTEIKIGNEEFLILNQKEVVVILDETQINVDSTLNHS
jgi:chaperonin GroES